MSKKEYYFEFEFTGHHTIYVTADNIDDARELAREEAGTLDYRELNNVEGLIVEEGQND